MSYSRHPNPLLDITNCKFKYILLHAWSSQKWFQKYKAWLTIRSAYNGSSMTLFLVLKISIEKRFLYCRYNPLSWCYTELYYSFCAKISSIQFLQYMYYTANIYYPATERNGTLRFMVDTRYYYYYGITTNRLILPDYCEKRHTTIHLRNCNQYICSV